MKVVPFLLVVAILLATFHFLPVEPSSVQAASTDLEFDVSADCNPHVDIDGPEFIAVLFFPVTSRSGVGQLSATLFSQGNDPQASTAQSWDFPQQGWHSVLFPGPPVQARFFCQNALPTRNLAVTYDRSSDAKISLSQTPTISTRELEQTGLVSTAILSVPHDDEQTTFHSAGEGTNTPYWLTFSLPVHSKHNIETTVKYTFP